MLSKEIICILPFFIRRIFKRKSFKPKFHAIRTYNIYIISEQILNISKIYDKIIRSRKLFNQDEEYGSERKSFTLYPKSTAKFYALPVRKNGISWKMRPAKFQVYAKGMVKK